MASPRQRPDDPQWSGGPGVSGGRPSFPDGSDLEAMKERMNRQREAFFNNAGHQPDSSDPFPEFFSRVRTFKDHLLLTWRLEFVRGHRFSCNCFGDKISFTLRNVVDLKHQRVLHDISALLKEYSSRGVGSQARTTCV